MLDVPTRQILWNIDSVANVVAMYLLLIPTFGIAAVGLLRRMELWASGKPAPEFWGNWWRRIDDLIGRVVYQHKVSRPSAGSAGIAHLLVYIGFMVLLFATTMVFIQQDLGIPIYQGNFYLIVTFLSDTFGLGLLIGIGYFAHRRYVVRADRVHNQWNDGFVLSMLALMVVQGFVLEGLRIGVTDDPWAWYSPVGLATAKFFWFLTPGSAAILHFGTWWFHTLTVYIFLALLPYTKFFHLASSSLNLFFERRVRPMGCLESPGDIEKLVEAGEEFSLGLGSIKDYSWKQLMDLDACTQCGRCQDACPAYLSGKPLSPKWVILDARNHALALHADGKLVPSRLPGFAAKTDQWLMKNLFLPANGLRPEGDHYKADGEYRARNPLVQNSVLTLGGNAEAKISGELMNPDVFWSCTTCMACVEACPVGINHVDQIVGNRRHMALMEGTIPAEAQPTLRALEARGNPFGPREDRSKWMAGLDVPIVKAGDSVDYLYWVGCVSAFDPRKQKIAKALVSIMKRAGLSFGVLGNEEGCTGDPARRLGEENLFQSLAKQNIELLKSIRFQTLVANCPHCFNTIKNEYPEFGNLGEGREPQIVHHSALLKRLLDNGTIALNDSAESFTFHDPCYLGRYNDEYDAPRDTIKKSKGLNIIEMPRSREKGLCCGAGGGHFWMDMKIGERVNVLRVEEAAATGASNIASACPFCMQMLEDGIKLTDSEDRLKVRDIAEVVAEQMR